MKLPLFCGSLCVFLAIAFAFTSISSQAKTRCPGDIEELRPRVVAGALLVIPVMINQTGPFDFMVDTGSQLNVIDPALAAQLNLQLQVRSAWCDRGLFPGVRRGIGFVAGGLATGVEPLAVVQDLGSIQPADPRIRGVLGENFIAHFDVFIDYGRRLLCLDQAKRLEKDLRGERIPLVL